MIRNVGYVAGMVGCTAIAFVITVLLGDSLALADVCNMCISTEEYCDVSPSQQCEQVAIITCPTYTGWYAKKNYWTKVGPDKAFANWHTTLKEMTEDCALRYKCKLDSFNNCIKGTQTTSWPQQPYVTVACE